MSKERSLQSLSTADHLSLAKSLDTLSSKGSAREGETEDIRSAGWIRKTSYRLVQSDYFGNFILLIILANTVIMCMETMDNYNRAYDFLVVIMSILSWIIPHILSNAPAFGIRVFRLFRVIRSIRALRSIRVLRTINFLRSLKLILGTIVKSIPAMKNIFILAGIMMYAFAAYGTISFNTVDPRRFGSIGRTIFRQFQIITTDTWTNFYRENQKSGPGYNTHLYLYTIAVLLTMHFIMLNLLIAVLKESVELELLEDEKVKISDTNLNTPKVADDLLSEGVFEEDIGLDNYYAPNIPQRHKKLLSRYFSLLSGLELNLQMQERQHKVLDDLVDLSSKFSRTNAS
ncbi:Cation channel sperm-associated protein 1 [Phlyctochytrium planicorne]|nr:Cation channel sperm-associated protein 1 [Phlyctochytrium planicorne]